MIEVSTLYGVTRFDGTVLELFDDRGKNHRFHVQFIEKLDFEPGKKGFMVMNVYYGKDGRSGIRGWGIPEENFEAVQQVADAVSRASGQK